MDDPRDISSRPGGGGPHSHDRLPDLRVAYGLGSLDEVDLAPTWLEQFERWLDEAFASEMQEPNAMVLATASADGVPRARTVLLRGVDVRGLRFHTNYESRKGRDLTANPRAAAVFLWRPQQRQVQVEGEVRRLGADESDAYFASRPRGARIGAPASPQSRAIASRAELERLAVEHERRFAGEEVPRPEHWGGYVLAPDRVEFWQGRPDRLHDRLSYRRADAGAWVVERLAP